MHIPEGVLSPPVLIASTAVSTLCIAIGLRKLASERMMLVALFASAFFVVTLIHIPLGAAGEVHLFLEGLLGVFLGWAAFPAVFVALILQAFFFQFGGITAIGFNTAATALPAVLCAWLTRKAIVGENPYMAMLAAFFCGAGAIVITSLIGAAGIYLSGKTMGLSATAVLIGHLPVALAEGALTAGIVSYIRQVRPQMLGSTNRLPNGDCNR